MLEQSHKLIQFSKFCNFPEKILNNVTFYSYQWGIFIKAIDETTAINLAVFSRPIEIAMRQLQIQKVIITIKEQSFLRFSLEDTAPITMHEVMAMAMNPDNLINLDIDVDALDLSHPEQIMTELCNLKYPTYITFLDTEEGPFYNHAEFLTMPDVPITDIANYARLFTYPEELANRNRLLRADGQLKNYSYKAMKPYKDGDIWRRKEVSFVVDFSLCEYFGRPSRIGIQKHEEDLRKFVD